MADDRVLVFVAFEDAKAYFEAAFARGEKERREFIMSGEAWDCVNCEIPTFRRLRDPAAIKRLFERAGEEPPAIDAPEQFDPAKLEAIVEKLKAEGRMPPLQDFIRTLGEVRKQYRPAILKEREKAREKGPKT